MVTRASWVLAKGNPENIPKESVIRHVPLVEKEKVVFVYEAHFKARAGNLVESLKDLSKLRTWSFHCGFKCMWRR